MEPDTAELAEIKTRRRLRLRRIAVYAVSRIILVIPTALILLTAVFVLMRIAGDPITAVMAGRVPADQLAQMLHEAGYDRPIIVQYLEYLGQLATGNFGVSVTENRPVTDIILQYGTATFELGIMAVLVALIVGIPLGIVAAAHRDHWQDVVLRVFSALAYATPIFFIGLVGKLVFGVVLGALPISGRASVETTMALSSLPDATGLFFLDAIRSGNFAALGDLLAHAALPAITLGIITGGVFIRLVRSQMVTTLSSEYVTAGSSRGIRGFAMDCLYALKPALGPILTVVGMQVAMVLGGAVLTETTFDWHGLGFQLSSYLTNHDYTAVQGIVAMIALVVSSVNCVVDIIIAIIDPRVRG